MRVGQRDPVLHRCRKGCRQGYPRGELLQYRPSWFRQKTRALPRIRYRSNAVVSIWTTSLEVAQLFCMRRSLPNSWRQSCVFFCFLYRRGVVSGSAPLPGSERLTPGPRILGEDKTRSNAAAVCARSEGCVDVKSRRTPPWGGARWVLHYRWERRNRRFGFC